MKKATPYFIIGIVFLVAFAPVVSCVFALKNDFFLGYFPPKFLLSETLKSGQFPLWNPYISFGLPFYADMNGAYWNPITWIIALTTGYNAYTLTAELLLYVLLGGLGMFKLSEHFATNKYIRLTASFSYLCNGFVIGHLQHLNWISCSAALPWCIWGILTIIKTPSIRNYLITALSFYLLISSSHPGMIIAAIYFFSGFTGFLILERRGNVLKQTATLRIKQFGLLLLLIVLLSLGLITSYVDIIPYFARNTKLSLELSLAENTTIQSWLSLLFPLGTVKNQSFYQNDIALRNNYFGLLLLVFLVFTLLTKKTRLQWFFILTAAFFFLLSVGGPFKQFAHKFLPLIGYVRINGEFRIFAIICFIILATQGFQKYADETFRFKKIIKKIIQVLVVIIFFLFSYSFFVLFEGHSGIAQLQAFNKSWRDSLKEFIDNLQFADTLLLQTVIQFTLLVFLIRTILKLQYKKTLLLTAIDVIIASLLNMPFTGVGKVSVQKINTIHQRSPNGIPMPTLTKLENYPKISNADSALVGDWTFYNKQPGSPKAVLYPVKLFNNLLYYDMLYLDSSISVAQFPFLFLSSTVNNVKLDNFQNLTKTNIIRYTVNNIHVRFNAHRDGHLIILQNHYPHWKFKTSDSEGKPRKASICFMAIPVKKGINDLNLYFDPKLIKLLSVLTAFILVAYIIVALLPISKNLFFCLKNK
ncbi:hypothetical protein [Lacibacter cauensis]|uniref:hypothetical protein n=1 Tax=Lacibacter cauensis TaxID=510947 RepID=UPI0011A899B8|nr:hypothetical protein [Lacibacter cauensis]